jgi:hypothetical protein
MYFICILLAYYWNISYFCTAELHESYNGENT